MERVNVAVDFSRKTDSELQDVTKEMYAALKDNTLFTFDDGKIDSFLTLINTYAKARIKAIKGGHLDVFTKNTLRKELQDEASDIAKIVRQQAKGDKTTLMSSGIPMWKVPDRHTEFAAPEIIKLSQGITHGKVIVEVPVMKRTRLYCIYYTSEPISDNSNSWETILSTKHKATITGLTPGSKVSVRAGYLGTNGKINQSEIFTIFVQ